MSPSELIKYQVSKYHTHNIMLHIIYIIELLHIIMMKRCYVFRTCINQANI